MDIIEAISEKKKRLHWQCRRGMLEIDFLLNDYLSKSYEKVNAKERDIFELFLTENDQQIFMWLTEQEVIPQKYEKLILKLRENGTK